MNNCPVRRCAIRLADGLRGFFYGVNAKADWQVSRELGCGQTEASATAKKVPAFHQKPGNRQPQLRRRNSGNKNPRRGHGRTDPQHAAASRKSVPATPPITPSLAHNPWKPVSPAAVLISLARK